MTADMSDIIQGIIEADERELALIFKAAQSRSKTIRDAAGLENLSTIYVGDTVVTSDNIKPKYLAGQVATVLAINPGEKFPFKLRFVHYVEDTKGRHVETCNFTATSVTKATNV